MPPIKPWHQVVELRADLKSGELSLAEFAADLYDVFMGTARPIYQDRREFFALTYPTLNLRELAKDVAGRLGGKNDKAIRQLELTYGGGKTHTLITLYHLMSDPDSLPDLPSVQEFTAHIGSKPPRARVVVLPFDKLDVEKGMLVKSPSGKTRWVRHPWSVMAFQIAGPDGLKLLSADGTDTERESAPAENLLIDLLSLPAKDGLATLVLIDEVLTYAREKIGLDAAWRSRLVNFFQYLTQAATKVDRCAVVASLLATDPRKSDSFGKEITQEIYGIFRRELDESVQPVVKDDVAEVLRRRFFTPDSIRDQSAFGAPVVAALKGIASLDEETGKEKAEAEERFRKSYPFHPDLTEVLYSKWTNLEGFQRTRGVLRTFALALRDAEKWDKSPLVAANVFLSAPCVEDISEAARELTNIAATEEYEGKKQEWTAILQGELAKAREIQAETGGLKHREVEQAVFATFLHSQPIGQKALTRDLLLLLGATKPDKIELGKALTRWTELSWFLDEAGINDAGDQPGEERQLPKSWRLGSKPNLKQMHYHAKSHVSPENVDARLIDEIGKVKSLVEGASGAGARVHLLPAKPSDIQDDGLFHYAVLGPKAMSEASKPSKDAVRFLEETTSPDKPRVYRNALVLVTPSKEGLDACRNAVLDSLAWKEVQSQLQGQDLDSLREEMLQEFSEKARKSVPDGIRHAYSVVVTVGKDNSVEAFKIAIKDGPLFALVKEDKRSRIQDTAVSAEALLPDGPYDLWQSGETSRRVKDLAGAFAQFPHLPKMLHAKEILETLVLGAKAGFFVLQASRPDRTVKTFWRQEPDEAAQKDPSLELVLPEHAHLTEIEPSLLGPNVLPDLWPGPSVCLREIVEYFKGGRTVRISREGYEEPVAIPRAERTVVEEAINKAVEKGDLWLTTGPASFWSEPVPKGILSDEAVLQAPPPAIQVQEVLPEALPEVWQEESTTAMAISAAISRKAGKVLPWATARNAIDAAIRARMLERAEGPWPCDFAQAKTVVVRVPSAEEERHVQPQRPPNPGIRTAEAYLEPRQIQELAERLGDLLNITAGQDLRFKVLIELQGKNVKSDVIDRLNDALRDVSPDLKI